MTGFAYLFTQVAALAAVSALVGLLVGRYLLPRHPGSVTVHPGGSPTPAAGIPTSPPTPAHGLDSDDLEPALSKLERRLRTSEAQVDDLRRAVAQVSDHKDAEMGRIEVGAIRALDSVISTHQQQLNELQSQLNLATRTAREQEERFEAERLLAERLRTVISARDERIAELSNQLSGKGSAVANGHREDAGQD
ncbi:MAG: hypothetical protein U0Q19_18185 [Kineosporiaceae bacterium]